MEASFCHSFTAPLASSRQGPILACPSSSGGGYLRQNYSARTHPFSPARLRAYLPRPLLGFSATSGRRSVRCAAVRTIVQSDFAVQVLESDIPVLVDFVADWCGPCRLISPIIEWASQVIVFLSEEIRGSASGGNMLLGGGPAYGVKSIRKYWKINLIDLEYNGRLKVLKIDHDANPKLIQAYKVYGLPTLILFKNGEEVPESRREGVITKIKLKEYLDSFLSSTKVV